MGYEVIPVDITKYVMTAKEIAKYGATCNSLSFGFNFPYVIV